MGLSGKGKRFSRLIIAGVLNALAGSQNPNALKSVRSMLACLTLTEKRLVMNCWPGGKPKTPAKLQRPPRNHYLLGNTAEAVFPISSEPLWFIGN